MGIAVALRTEVAQFNLRRGTTMTLHSLSCTGLAITTLVLSACAAMPTGLAVSERDFATIQTGMTREQVVARFGPPTWSFKVRQENLTIMNYRYSHSDCTIYQVSVRPDSTVRDAGPAWDPACDVPE
jgi:hypothetical protein